MHAAWPAPPGRPPWAPKTAQTLGRRALRTRGRPPLSSFQKEKYLIESGGMEERIEELGGKVYAAIVAGGGGRGGTYGEEDLRRYARYAVRSAEIYYEEFFRESRESREAVEQGGKERGGMDGGL